MGFGYFLWWVCLCDQRQVSLIYVPINFDSNASWSSPPPLGLYVYNLISGLLLANVAINLWKSSECKLPSSFKDFADTAATTSSARAPPSWCSWHLGFFYCAWWPSCCWLKNKRACSPAQRRSRVIVLSWTSDPSLWLPWWCPWLPWRSLLRRAEISQVPFISMEHSWYHFCAAYHPSYYYKEAWGNIIFKTWLSL